MMGRCSRVSRYSRIGGGRRAGGGGDRCPRGSRYSRVGAEGFLEVVEIGALDFLGGLELGLEGIFVAERVGAIGFLGGLWLGCKEGLWGLSAF